jgi:hypothetical protein
VCVCVLGTLVVVLSMIGVVLYVTSDNNPCKPPPAFNASQDCALYIGDSISIGIVEALSPAPCVVRPAQNCLDTATGKQCIDTWLDNRNWSLVLVNFGLWDRINTPLAVYLQTMEELLLRITASSQRVLFVTTTPTRDETQQETPAIVAMYNAVLQPMLAEHNLTQCDLYSVVQEACSSDCYADAVHFTSQTYAHILAPTIASCIERMFIDHE